MRKVQIYIEGERIELFADEIISLTSSVQNVQDIAKVFTDFTQSFTVPASPYNNAIFQHFYESAVDGTIDHQLRREAQIEIDLIPFRTGKIQIEKSNLKKGMVESYTITFYGDIRTLQDYFGDDKLNTLDLTPYTHTYSGSEIETRITSSSDYDVRYPLISSDRLWQYGGGGAQDISQNSHHIHYNELFPALKISKIFEAIETKYGIDFIGTFLTDDRFDKCHLYLKNANTFSYSTAPLKADIVSYAGDNTYSPFDITEDTLHYEYQEFTPNFPPSFPINSGTHKVTFSIFNTSSSAVEHYVDVYKNGQLVNTITGTGNHSYVIVEDNNILGLDNTYYFNVRANSTLTYQTSIDYTFSFDYWISSTELQSSQSTAWTINASQSLSGDLDLTAYIPDMLISDFVAGILKEFNLTCYGLGATTFQVEPLEDWYAKGRLIDVTKHIDIDSIDVERIKLYKRIAFSYEDSNSFMNQEFTNNFGRKYGNLEQLYDYDGSDYEVKVPFENLLFNRFTGTDLQVGYNLDSNFNPYVPKPTLLYLDDQKTVSFYFNNGSTTDHITSYMPMGQDLVYNDLDYTLNWGNEISSLKDYIVPRHLFQVYYSTYLSNLYYKKNRLYYVKGLFPTAILTSIKLNDRLIIRDKRYIINEMKTNTNTGEVDLVLLQDFRPFRRTKFLPSFKPAGGIIKYKALVPNGVTNVYFDPLLTGITFSANNFAVDTDIEITVPANTNTKYTLIAENSDSLFTEDYQNIRSEEGEPLIYVIEITYTYSDGTTEVEQQTITLDD